ncbi:nucleotidyltransferase [Bacillus sp. CRN 9]|nr:nucleotidyltransferase [Bacillus sp. CRN 9]
MLIQKEMINTVKNKCSHDYSVLACMMYGSFTKGEGDQYSDVEFYIFIADDVINHFNSRHWISEIAPIDMLFSNEYGTEVAIFSNIVRGEFHFLPVSEIGIIKTFKSTGVFPDTKSMHIYDSTGQLKPLLEYLGGTGPDRMTNENVNFAFNNFVNAWLMGVNVMKRGELARSLELLTSVQKNVLQLIRVKEKTVERWLNSTKNLEQDISKEAYNDYVLLTAKLDENEIRHAYINALKVVEKLYNLLVTSYTTDINKEMISKLYHHLKS